MVINRPSCHIGGCWANWMEPREVMVWVGSSSYFRWGIIYAQENVNVGVGGEGVEEEGIRDKKVN